jgi:pyruvate dehydrogenase E2 component (dihydrolipoamide acetyltransferase)
LQEKRIKLRGIQKIIARKMAKSKQTIPHVTTIREVNLDQIVDVRERLKSRFSDRHITYMPFIIKAVAEALKAYPIINSSLDDSTDEIIIKGDINIGFAIAVGDNLLVPVIRNVEELDFMDIVEKMDELIKRSRNNQLTPGDFKDGTFTISNSGAYGGEIFTPIINYPESAILGIGKIQKKPVVNEKDEIVISYMIYLCLSYDHRIINGATAVQFLGELEKQLKQITEHI